MMTWMRLFVKSVGKIRCSVHRREAVLPTLRMIRDSE